MSKARDEYYKWIDDGNWKVREFIKPYVSKLEQQNKEFEDINGDMFRRINELETAEMKLVGILQRIKSDAEDQLDYADLIVWKTINSDLLQTLKKYSGE